MLEALRDFLTILLLVCFAWLAAWGFADEAGQLARMVPP